MWDVFTQAANNVYMSFENVILLLAFFGGMIFYSRDFRIGAILHFVVFALIFMWFYTGSLNYYGALTLAFMFLVIMAFSFYAVDSQAQTGGLI